MAKKTTTIAEQVIAYREANKLSRQKFADLTGLTGAKVSNIEKGRVVKPDEESRILAVLNSNGEVITDADEDTVVYPQPEPVEQGEGAASGPQPQDVGAPPAFSNSELQCFKRCKRKWWLAFYRQLGLKQREATGARSIGTRVHAALANWYTVADQRLNPYEVLHKTIAEDAEAFPDQAHEIRQEAELCQAMLEGYFEWVAETGADEGLEVIGPEQVITQAITLSDGRVVLLRGRLDVRTHRARDGVVLFLDHKSVGNLTEPQRTLHMDEQMLMYHLLEYLQAVAEGRTAEVLTGGGLYNMLRKVKRTSQAKPPFYERVEARHNIRELESMYMRVVGEIEEVVRLRERLDGGADHRYAAYPTPKRDCTWDCDFFPICPLFDDGSNVDGLVEQLYTHVDPYERYVTTEAGE